MNVNDASRIVIDESRVTLQIVASLTDDSREIFYNCKMFIEQATGWKGSSLIGLFIGDEEKKVS